MARLREGVATSAGGIVIRFADGRPQLVVGMRRRDRDALTWTLPKGTPKPGETLEETAVREVSEETGLDVTITGPLGPIEYWFVQRGTRIHKTVHYFSMESRGGDLSRHDREFEQVRWLDLGEAGSTLTFETERDLVARAARQIGIAGAPTAAIGTPAAPAPAADGTAAQAPPAPVADVGVVVPPAGDPSAAPAPAGEAPGGIGRASG